MELYTWLLFKIEVARAGFVKNSFSGFYSLNGNFQLKTVVNRHVFELLTTRVLDTKKMAMGLFNIAVL